LLVLLWCAPVGAVSLADLASQLAFSGNASRTSDAANGHLTIGGNNLMPLNHDLTLEFRDSASRRNRHQSKALNMRYSRPVAGGNFSMALKNSHHDGEARTADQRFDARQEYQSLDFSGSRALWSWQGLELEGLFSHSSDTSSAYEESEWVADSTHRLSRLVLRCSGKSELPGGFMAGSSLAAMGGWEARESVSTDDSSSGGSRYHKLALTASVNRAFYTWDIAVDGHFQFAPEDLASSEYLQVAGPSMMRGFNGQSKSVSEGGWLRVNARSPGYPVPLTDAFNSYFMFSVLRGWSSESVVSGGSFRATAGEISLRLLGKGFNASLSAGQILDLSGRAMRRPASPDVSLTLTMGI
jgi:hemolysin activation/secretion protein